MSAQSHIAALERISSQLSACVVECGRASTRDGHEGSGDDPRGLQPARAIRRALANGRLKAADVELVCACFDPHSSPHAYQRARDSIALAFGPYSSRLVVDLRPARGDTAASMAQTEARCRRAIAREQVRIGLTVSIGIAGVNTAVAFRTST